MGLLRCDSSTVPCQHLSNTYITFIVRQVLYCHRCGPQSNHISGQYLHIKLGYKLVCCNHTQRLPHKKADAWMHIYSSSIRFHPSSDTNFFTPLLHKWDKNTLNTRINNNKSNVFFYINVGFFVYYKSIIEYVENIKMKDLCININFFERVSIKRLKTLQL